MKPTRVPVVLSILNPEFQHPQRPLREGAAYCCQCGRLVEPFLQHGHVKQRRCSYHTWSKMMPPGFISRAFESMRRSVS
jgi:hypothetical protein